MNIEFENVSAWSETIFGTASLGDKRLNRRLIQIGKQLSSFPGASLAASCEGKDALIEGSYRFLRNDRVTAKQIATGGYTATGALAQTIPTLLAIEDTTTLSYSHQVKESLGDLGGPASTSNRGFHVHSTMLMDADKEKTLGLIAQERWCRDVNERGKRHTRQQRNYTEKESYKWERNTREVERHLGAKMSDVISVCDREADIFEYIQYKSKQEQRFIVRSRHNRKLEGYDNYLLDALASAKSLGDYTVEIAQKANRKKRTATLELKATSVTILPSKQKGGDEREMKPITLNAVIATEKPGAEASSLEWILLTTEAIDSFECARKITRYYELRWRIEEFHKAWKSGVGVEEQRMQSAESLEKMVVILSFVAIRLMQLKEYFEMPSSLDCATEDVCCNELLSDIEWKVLWSSIEKEDIPSSAPSAAWAYRAIARLGGWTDSKRTGKAAWSTIWNGWFRLSERIEGARIAAKQLKM